ncbi:hypothetical protein HK099_008459 [Clydaea vesicula]|uniref:CAP-Gly domain-containing protein n=1 Tax=Clydaea vesicula TaxID=447962 RepID=A0AAD5U4U4_9FUNG|nr:hypothetical protein HK099_008459 [Clydaea vesicula]
MVNEVSLPGPSLLTLFITSESSSSERRFEKSITIGTLKEKLEFITGVPCATCKLILYTKENNQVAVLDDDTKMLGFYPVYDFMRIEAVDTNPHRIHSQYTDLSKVKKFEISQEEYEKKTDSVRAFKERNKIGRFSEKEAEPTNIETFEEEAKALKIGARCEVDTDGYKKRGEVRFIGSTTFKPGFWVGVKYDEPVGIHNGTVDGVKYFECQNKFGAMVRPNKVKVGDFPEENLFEDDDDEM